MKNATLVRIAHEATLQQGDINSLYGDNIPEGLARDAYDFSRAIQHVVPFLMRLEDQSNAAVLEYIAQAIEAYPDAGYNRSAVEYIRAEIMMRATFGEVEA